MMAPRHVLRILTLPVALATPALAVAQPSIEKSETLNLHSTETYIQVVFNNHGESMRGELRFGEDPSLNQYTVVGEPYSCKLHTIDPPRWCRARVHNLTPGTRYYFRGVAMGRDGAVFGPIESFVTPSTDPHQAPALYGFKVYEIGSTFAKISFGADGKTRPWSANVECTAAGTTEVVRSPSQSRPGGIVGQEVYIEFSNLRRDTVYNCAATIVTDYGTGNGGFNMRTDSN